MPLSVSHEEVRDVNVLLVILFTHLGQSKGCGSAAADTACTESAAYPLSAAARSNWPTPSTAS